MIELKKFSIDKDFYMKEISQIPTDPDFVQNPYHFYKNVRGIGPFVYWKDYSMVTTFDHSMTAVILKDRRFGREVPKELVKSIPQHLLPFYKNEAHSMLELEPPAHTRLRGLVLRAFTSRRIKELEPEINVLCNQLIDKFPSNDFDLIPSYANQIPVIVIARLLGVPENMSNQLLKWSNDMVSMYQARRNREIEDRAVKSCEEFVSFMNYYVKEKRSKPADDLITHLIQAEEEGEKLSTDELITTCILLLNAGHEATVHSIGNGVKTLLESKVNRVCLEESNIGKTIEEILRFDPPLHMFTRYAYEDVHLEGHSFKRGDEVALMLGAAGRDPKAWDSPEVFLPTRPIKTNTAFGGGIHFCVGAPLARLELKVGLAVLFNRCPKIKIKQVPQYADLYHFHGLKELIVET